MKASSVQSAQFDLRGIRETRDCLSKRYPLTAVEHKKFDKILLNRVSDTSMNLTIIDELGKRMEWVQIFLSRCNDVVLQIKASYLVRYKMLPQQYDGGFDKIFEAFEMQALETIFRRYPEIRPTNFAQEQPQRESVPRNTAACCVVPALLSLNATKDEDYYIPTKQKMVEEERKGEPELERQSGSLHDHPSPPTFCVPAFMKQNTSDDQGFPSATYKMIEEDEKRIPFHLQGLRGLDLPETA